MWRITLDDWHVVRRRDIEGLQKRAVYLLIRRRREFVRSTWYSRSIDASSGLTYLPHIFPSCKAKTGCRVGETVVIALHDGTPVALKSFYGMKTLTVEGEREFLSSLRLAAEGGGTDSAFFDNLVRRMEERAGRWRNGNGPLTKEEHAKLLEDKWNTLDTIEEERRRNVGARPISDLLVQSSRSMSKPNPLLHFLSRYRDRKKSARRAL